MTTNGQSTVPKVELRGRPRKGETAEQARKRKLEEAEKAREAAASG